MFDSWTREGITMFGAAISFFMMFGLWVIKYYEAAFIFAALLPMLGCLVFAYIIKRE